MLGSFDKTFANISASASTPKKLPELPNPDTTVSPPPVQLTNTIDVTNKTSDVRFVLMDTPAISRTCRVDCMMLGASIRQMFQAILYLSSELNGYAALAFPRELAEDCDDPGVFRKLAGFGNPYQTQVLPVPRAVQ
jgi:hypothetical protein